MYGQHMYSAVLTVLQLEEPCVEGSSGLQLQFAAESNKVEAESV